MNRYSFNTNWFFRPGTAVSDRQAIGPITLPHDAMQTERRRKDAETGHAGGYFPGGTYVYEKSFDLPEDAQGKSILFEFEGVYQRSTIYINGKKAGGWPYGYSRFYVNADPYLIYNAVNRLRVVVDNSNVPNSRWYSGSGIYRNVNLLTGNQVHIPPNGVRISTLSVDEPASIQVETRISNGANLDCRVRVEILDGEALVAEHYGALIAVLEVPHAKLWSDLSPNLYTCRVTLLADGSILDEVQETFGIRSVECTPHEGLLINGKPTKLRGACVHHDNGILGAATLAAAEERRVKILKDAGFNAIRSAHNPMSIAMLEACDRYGMVVMDELTDTWWLPKTTGDYSLEFMDWWERDLASMVDKDFNHPSVIMYSVGNEISETAFERGIGFCKLIAAKTRELDPTRLVTIGINLQLNQMNYQGRGHYKERGESGKAEQGKQTKDMTTSAYVNTVMNVMKPISGILLRKKSVDLATREAFGYVDVAGYNYGTGRYLLDGRLHPERVIVGSETYPPDIDRNWQLVQQLPYLIGDFQWTGWDYLGEAGVGMWQYGKKKGPLYKDYPCILANVGVIDITGYLTAQAYYNKVVWGLEPKPYIGVRPVNLTGQRPSKSVWRGTNAIASWSWAGQEGRRAVIEVFSIGASVELVQDGTSLGRKRLKRRKAMFKTVYRPGELVAVSYDAQGRELARSSMKTAASATVLTALPEALAIKADGQDLAFIPIHITDPAGIVKMLEDRSVTVDVEGAGTLAAVGSSNPWTEEAYTGTSFTTYYGRMLAIVRSNGEQGQIRVRVSSAGLDSTEVILDAR
jgi:beta-galactosidase